MITIAVGDPVLDLTAAVSALDRAGITPRDLALRRPSLDDVFPSLTGHRTATDNADSPVPGTRRSRPENATT